MLRPSIEVNYGQKLDKLKIAPWLVSDWLTCTRIGNVMWEKSNKLSQHKKTEPVSFYLLMVTATFNFNPIIPRVNWMILTFIWVVKQELISPKLAWIFSLSRTADDPRPGVFSPLGSESDWETETWRHFRHTGPGTLTLRAQRAEKLSSGDWRL